MIEGGIDAQAKEKINEASLIITRAEEVKKLMKECIRWQGNQRFIVDRKKESILEELTEYKEVIEKRVKKAKEALIKYSEQFPFLYWIEETQGMKIIDAI